MPIITLRYVADGFLEDAENLVSAYCATETLRFYEFSRLWRESEFSLVFMGRQTERELCEFTGECFMITLCLLERNEGTRYRVGVLYLLYSLYFKQPLEQKYKIRIQAQHWREIVALFEFGKKNHHATICCVINTLVEDRAFLFVACPRLMGPQSTLTDEPWKVQIYSDNVGGKFNDYLDEGDLSVLSNVHKQYEEAKSKLKDAEEEYFNLLQGNKYDELASSVKDFTSNRQLVHNCFASVFTDEEDSVDKIGTRRTDIKKKQFSKVSRAQKSKRCLELLSDLQSEEEEEEDDDVLVVDDPDYCLPEEAKKKKEPVIRRRGRPRTKPRLRGRKSRKSREAAIAKSSDMDMDEQEILDENEIDFEPEINVVDGVPVPSFNGRRVELRRRVEKGRKTRYHYASDSEEDPFLCIEDEEEEGNKEDEEEENEDDEEEENEDDEEEEDEEEEEEESEEVEEENEKEEGKREKEGENKDIKKECEGEKKGEYNEDKMKKESEEEMEEDEEESEIESEEMKQESEFDWIF